MLAFYREVTIRVFERRQDDYSFIRSEFLVHYLKLRADQTCCAQSYR